MQWLKGLGISLKVAIGALLMAMAVMAYQREKGKGRKWQQKSVDVLDDQIETGALTVKAANAQAKLHDNKATELKKKAEAHAKDMGGKNETVANILHQFRHSS